MNSWRELEFQDFRTPAPEKLTTNKQRTILIKLGIKDIPQTYSDSKKLIRNIQELISSRKPTARMYQFLLKHEYSPEEIQLLTYRKAEALINDLIAITCSNFEDKRNQVDNILSTCSKRQKEYLNALGVESGTIDLLSFEEALILIKKLKSKRKIAQQ